MSNKIILFVSFVVLSLSSYGQYRWELTGGATYSDLKLDNADVTPGTGLSANIGYEYVMGVRAATTFVFSLDAHQRSSEVKGVGKMEALQVGFNPKFRYLTGDGKSRFRGFVNVGPSFRLNTGFKQNGVKLEDTEYEQLIIGGVYGIGFSQMIGEMFDIMAEAGVMNDFIDNIVDTNSKFFDIYARIGVRFRIYDSRR